MLNRGYGLPTDEMELIHERYDLMKERIWKLTDDASFCGIYEDYVRYCAGFIKKVFEVYERIVQGRESIGIETFEEWNTSLYEDITPEHYEMSYSNPSYAVEKFGTFIGQRLCFVYTELRSLIPSAYEGNLFDLVIYSELFVEVVTVITQELEADILEREIQDAIYNFERDYSELIVARRIENQLNPEFNFARDIIMDNDLSDVKYLYYYGEFVGANELETAQYLNSLSEDEIDSMAFTYTDGYREGFEIAGIDLSKKNTVNIRYNIGFERMVKAAIVQFEKLGLQPAIYPAATKSLDKKRHLKIGYTGTSVNKQYDYDHRFDDGLYLDKAMVERRLEVVKSTYEAHKELCKGYAGPAVIEIFGEKNLEPQKKEEAISYTNNQQKLSVTYASKSAQIVNEYLPHDQYSFTIIAYPVPEIGEQYKEIFSETVRVNTLDKSLYRQIQQKLIDALDQASYVHVLGSNGNSTDMKVMLHDKKDPAKETNFENCLADVNIPVGEVFTSPKLTGTEGTLNVSSVYLNDLYYKNLTIQFKDGMVQSYDCSNYDEKEQNQAFIKENLMNHRETLPIGEFAIGTNTTAYVMARKYNIVNKLPILIVEKMGPHFAVGDTCYSHSEEVRLYNPDGKEIVAKENECSLKRFEDESEAYFNIHTDITIPYDEIGLIEAICEDGTAIPLLKNGKFVLEGTQVLNLDEMN